MADRAGKPGWFQRLKAGLGKSAQSIGSGVADILTKRKLDAETLEDLEDLLIASDLGVATAAKVGERLAETRHRKDITPAEVRRVLADTVAEVLAPVARPMALDPVAQDPVAQEKGRPHVVLVVGVNGTGKTTTIGKLAKRFTTEGRSVVLAAGDTFRAAAIDQLRIWGDRAGAPVVTAPEGADPASLAFDAHARARADGADILLMDTAGRLQNRAELMDELKKIVRVLGKQDPDAPHETILVLDATTGQNAVNQVQAFKDMVNVSGLVMTKLDGSAKGGVLVALAEKFGLPIHFIGVGEGVDDLQPFDADAFASALAGTADEEMPQ